MLKHYFLTTIRTLRQNTLYTVLSVFGIALTFVFVSVMLLLAKSSKGEFIPPKYAERTWQVSSIVTETGDFQWISKEFYDTWISKMKTPEITVVTNFEVLESTFAKDNLQFFVLQCIEENYFDVCRLKFLKGRPFSKHELIDGTPVAIIDRSTKELLFNKSEDPLLKTIEFFGTEYKIVGVVENNSFLTYEMHLTNGNVWLPVKATPQDTRFVVSFTAKDKASVSAVQDEFNRILDEYGTVEGNKWVVPLWQRNTINNSSKMFQIFSIFGLLILMLIPGLNILSLNISKSFDRNEEIAIRKTFGAPLHTIFGQLIIENIMITLVGAIIGMSVTPYLMNGIDRAILKSGVIPITLSLQFDWVTVFLAAVPCVLVFSFLTGSVPALITAKRDIVNVLKGEIK